MRGENADFARLQHILEAISEIEKYTAKRSFDDFLNDSMFRFACIKQMEIIGEAANHVFEITRQKFPEVEWGQIVGMRNVFVYEYFGIDLNVAWDIIENDIPDLKLKLLEVMKKL